MKIRVVIECYVDENSIGPLELSAKAPLRSRIFLKKDFIESSMPQAWKLLRACFEVGPRTEAK